MELLQLLAKRGGGARSHDRVDDGDGVGDAGAAQLTRLHRVEVVCLAMDRPRRRLRVLSIPQVSSLFHVLFDCLETQGVFIKRAATISSSERARNPETWCRQKLHRSSGRKGVRWSGQHVARLALSVYGTQPRLP